MDRNKIFYLILAAAIIIILVALAMYRHNAVVDTSKVQTEYQEQKLPIDEETADESENNIKEQEQAQEEVSVPAVNIKKAKVNVIKGSANKSDVKEPFVKTIIDGNSIRIDVPEAQPQKVVVPPSEPRADVVTVSQEYKMKSPEKYKFK